MRPLSSSQSAPQLSSAYASRGHTPYPASSSKPETGDPPASAAAVAREERNLMRHFSALLTRDGKRGELILAQANQQLRHRYGILNPIQKAVAAIKPVIKYQKSKAKTGYYPITLYPKTADGIAIRWIIEAAERRQFVGGRPLIARGLVDEIDAIIQGTSALFSKRFNTHRNPN